MKQRNHRIRRLGYAGFFWHCRFTFLKDSPKKTDVIPEKEVIEVEVYEVLQQDLEQLRSALELKEVIIQEKDQNVEALEKKIEGRL